MDKYTDPTEHYASPEVKVLALTVSSVIAESFGYETGHWS